MEATLRRSESERESLASELFSFKSQVSLREQELEEVRQQAEREKAELIEQLRIDSEQTQQELIERTEVLMREK